MIHFSQKLLDLLLPYGDGSTTGTLQIHWNNLLAPQLNTHIFPLCATLFLSVLQKVWWQVLLPSSVARFNCSTAAGSLAKSNMPSLVGH
ncbi:hypothetical protein FEM48_Zijuj12G0168900 [Ziziphus jujuba var. spinosa]|uniref:Uncharacterized protein n=1 Tax=Ziziphus jujuba var. spinosa TaxID=714518 RepID=A0A978UEI5_ZIZJJ|nr:hypothetical protein FEM48_Zijuj12G0168900 [Ziziphus jujuba var. spinosa]